MSPLRARSASVSLLCAAAAACGGKAGARHAAPADVPVELLTRAPEAVRIVQVHRGVAYLFLRRLDPFAEDGPQPCWIASEEERARCPATEPLPAGLDPGPVPATLTVLGTAGPCTATVGAPVLVDTSGCEPTTMVGAPLSGCPLDLAPIARTDGFDPALRWHPAPAVTDEPLAGAATRLTDPVHRALVGQWLAEPALARATFHDGRTARVTLDVGAEALETVTASFLVGDQDDQCEWQVDGRTAVGVRRGDHLQPLAVAGQWDGAVSWRGRLVGVVSGQPRDVRVQAVGPDGQVVTVLDAEVWWDNEECREPGWASVEYPCGL